MTPRQKHLVARTWSTLQGDAEATSAAFYRNVFAISPNARRLFGNKDMRLQGTLFMQMLALFMRGLSEENGAIDAITASGRRHVIYGVTYSDYDDVGRALLATLGDLLGPKTFTTEVRDAWATAYHSLAAAMRQASSSVV